MRRDVLVVPRWAAAFAIASAMTFAPAVSFAETWVGDANLGASEVAAPAKDEVVPNKAQYTYAKEELAAFCHFGPNTIANVEWGEHYGSTDASGKKWETATYYMNQLESFDAKEYVKAIKDAGFKRLIVTAKHHDGFRMWDSQSSKYDMGDTERKIDVLAEISKECTAQGLDMGLYLSPWDINDPTYGSGCSADKGCPTGGCGKDHNGDYNESYRTQLQEILGDKKYGRDGKFVEVWMDGAKGTGGGYQEYDFDSYYKLIKQLEGETCLAFQCGVNGEARWVGNEDGVAHDTTWNRVQMREHWDPKTQNQPFDQTTTKDPSTGKNVIVGNPNGTKWFMPEADARITSGWFWGPDKAAPKSLTELGTMYFTSVGRGAPLLLNVPLDTAGKLTPQIKQRVEEFGTNIATSFANDLTRANEKDGRAAATAQATSVWQDNAAFGPGKMLDGQDDTYWSAKNPGAQSVLIALPKATQFDVVSIEEAIQNGQRIESFKVFYRNGEGAQWTEFGRGGTVGAKRLVRAPKVTATQVKIELTPLAGKTVQLSEVGLFKMSRALESPSAIPEGMETVDNKDMTKQGSWEENGGAQFVNGTNMFSKAQGASATFEFTGTKFVIIGTSDPGHGQMKVTIDGDAANAQVVSTAGKEHKKGQRLFASQTLAEGKHTVKVEAVEGKAIAVDAAAVLNNGGVGMLEFDEPVISMDEDSTYELGITRSGGSTGAAEVVVNFEPGTAVQGDFYTEAVRVSFGPGETSKKVKVRTKRNNTGANAAVNTQFSVSMTPISPANLVIGPQGVTTVNIIDRDSNYTKEKLAEALKAAEGTSVNEGSHSAESAAAYRAALVNARSVAADTNATADQVFHAMKALDQALANAQVRTEPYSAEKPFAFPSNVGETQTIEGELATLVNKETDDVVNGKSYPMAIKEIEGASGGKVVNAIGKDDTVMIPFVAERAGEYEVTLRYMSGAEGNKLVWGDAVSEDGTADIPVDAEVATDGASDSVADKVVEAGGVDAEADAEPADGKGSDADSVEGAQAAADDAAVTAADEPADEKNAAGAPVVAADTSGADEAQDAGGVERASDVADASAGSDAADVEQDGVDDANRAADVVLAGGEQVAGGDDQNVFKTVTFAFTVKKPGASQLVFTGPQEKSPRIDKLDIKLKASSLTEYGIVAQAGTGGTIDPAGYFGPQAPARQFTVTPNEGYLIRSVTVGDKRLEVPDAGAPFKFEVSQPGDAKGDLLVTATFDKKVEAPAPPEEPDPNPGPTPRPAPNPDPAPNPGPGSSSGSNGGSGSAGGGTPRPGGSLPQTGDPATAAAVLAGASAPAFAAALSLTRRKR